ncbi:MAG: leucine--tRNA ligase [Bacteroidetes bacterium]|nr:MAG: leucine--tRNA ligase [Bacteroidota bacterium]
MEYAFNEIEKKWRAYWASQKTFAAKEEGDKPKFYALDMFPYPSGAGLHVGHPLGYIASDIVARYKRHQGFNVLHPMGYDSFGLPAEQYAIQTGQHPAITTEENISRYREQLDQIGFSFDWDREVRTSNPDFYRWTQWIFLQLFDSWYDEEKAQARPIEDLIWHLHKYGTEDLHAAAGEDLSLSPEEWEGFDEATREQILQNYRLAYRSESTVNWCPALGTVLANDEVKDGLSERGGHPVVQKKMMQWSMRITAYAERLLAGLEEIDWTESLKDSQRNWIGRSEGALLSFALDGHADKIQVFSTRPDTIFGATFMVLAPEHYLVNEITTADQAAEIKAYQEQAARKSERDRLTEVKTVSGAFTGAYALHPFSGAKIPIWIGDYVLASYGTGAVMAVPAHDSRDWSFAKHFNIPIVEVVSGGNITEASYDAKEGKMVNSDFLNGLDVKEAIGKAITAVEDNAIGESQINFRLRDAVFGRQRYWGEPIPIYFKDGLPRRVKEEHLPLNLPAVDAFLPTEDGEPPLARAQKWSYHPDKGVVSADEGYPLETTTMPGWAGSSWYDLRYMDSQNNDVLVSPERVNYWCDVDLYIGGNEHATGHLLYTRFWHKFLKDRGLVQEEEPFKKLINQGMILGYSAFAYRVDGENTFVSADLADQYSCTKVHVDVNMVNASDELDVEAFKAWRDDLATAKLIFEGAFKVTREVEKMSKSKFNVVNPDDIIAQYGADTLRLYEMFLGPLEQSKPWNTAGISGVHSFLRKLWRLYFKEGELTLSEEVPNEKELKVLHTLIKKVNEDINNFSFNTSVSAFMIAVNSLGELKCTKRAILGHLPILISPYAPHIAEELWSRLGNTDSIAYASFPQHEEQYLTESNHNYPVSFNGKMRFTHELPLSLNKEEIEKAIFALERTQQYLEGKTIRKVIVVPGKIVNIVAS